MNFENYPNESRFTVCTWNIGPERYFHVGTSDFKNRHKKLTVADVTGIPGFWADIDFKKPDSPKPYPPNKETALEIIDSFIWKPSLIVDTGGGFHCYWEFKEFYEIDDTNRQEIAGHSRDFQSFLRSHFEKSGYTIDATHDLSRLLRVWGTDEKPVYNSKHGVPRPVTVFRRTDNRYNISDIIEILPDSSDETQASPTYSGDYTLSKNNQPPLAKLEALCENSIKFNQTWSKTRADLKDQSPSGYSASLAQLAAYAGWSNQEIADLIMYWRIKHNYDSKLNRPDWYDRLIKWVRTNNPSDVYRDDDSTADETYDPFHEASLAIELPIEKIEKHGNNEYLYVIVLKDGRRIEFSTVKQLAKYSEFRLRVFECINVFPKARVKQANWEELLQGMANHMVVIDHNDADPAYQTHELVMDLGVRVAVQDKTIGVMQTKHFVDQGTFYLHANRFIEILQMRNNKVSAPKIRERLTRLGFVQCVVSAKTEKGLKQARFWKIDLDKLKGFGIQTETPSDSPF